MFWQRRIFISIIIAGCNLTETIDAFAGYIWNMNTSSFVSMVYFKNFETYRKEILDRVREKENHDFENSVLNITAFEEKNLIDFSHGDKVITGVHGDTWRLLAEMLNFKLNVIRSHIGEYGTQNPNGSWTGLMGVIYRNETHIIPRVLGFPSRLSALEFTLSVWSTGYRLYLKTEWSYDPTWMISMFVPALWISILALFVLLSFTSYSIQVWNPRNIKTHESATWNDHAFYVYSVMCNQGNPHDATKYNVKYVENQDSGFLPSLLQKRSKILLLSTSLCGWLTMIAFNSNLVSHMTHREPQRPFTDLESLYEHTDYTLLVKPNSFVYGVFQRAPRKIYQLFLNSKRLMQVDAEEAYRKCCTGKYVYFDSEDNADAKGSYYCQLNFAGRSYYQTWITSGLVRGFKYRRAINSGILKLHEFGFLNKLKSKWLTKTKELKAMTSVNSIELQQVYLVFGILSLGIFMSVMILVAETIIHRTNEKQKISRRRRKPRLRKII